LTVSDPHTSAGGEFDAYYFEHCCGRPYKRDDHWLKFFGGIADHVVQRIQPKRVLDAGCAMGLLVESLRDRGVDAEGVDISSYAIDHVADAAKPYCRVGSIADELSSRYDLIVTIEVLEHVPAPVGEAAIANFCRHTDDVLFSSTPGDYREPTHVNVRPAEYWAELFAEQGFFRDVDFDAAFLTPWAVRFRRRTEPLARIVRDYERGFAAAAAERNDRRQFAAEVQGQLETALDRVRHLETVIEREQQQSHAERVALREELGGVRAALEATHANLTGKLVEVQAAQARADTLQAESDRKSHELTHARATIEMMERSVFWRMRRWLGRS
jgi:hypothetical protein